MSADRLREAAALLRERAESASEFVPGRWDIYREPGLGHVVTNDDGWVCVVGDNEGDRELTAYIATMSPPVALALADWLDFVAEGRVALDAVSAEDSPSVLFRDTERHALTVADAILGGTK
jgi:hypothetical protein